MMGMASRKQITSLTPLAVRMAATAAGSPTESREMIIGVNNAFAIRILRKPMRWMANRLIPTIKTLQIRLLIGAPRICIPGVAMRRYATSSLIRQPISMERIGIFTCE